MLSITVNMKANVILSHKTHCYQIETLYEVNGWCWQATLSLTGKWKHRSQCLIGTGVGVGGMING